MSTNLPPLESPPSLLAGRAPSQIEERHSYLLRLWRSGADGAWRASLQSVQTGERHMFADLASLLTFLLER
ncbi:MAG: hypothetical protein DYG89_28675 [Caldilinea sp. CFX5]|nr:hypothetical protein [Caldilinea sp. CFX5]